MYIHMGWDKDALTVAFAHQKNNQQGDRPRDPRHIYANPLNPSICPILLLGIYWLVTGFDDTGRLFPGMLCGHFIFSMQFELPYL